MITFALLAGAILLESAATLSLRLASGGEHQWLWAIVVAGYAGAFGVLTLILRRGMPVGVAYGIWSAVGIVLIAGVGAVFLHDRLSLVQAGGIALIVVGVAAVELGHR